MNELDKIRDLIQGKRVVSVDRNGDQLTLDDGTILWLYMSDSDCCANAEGEWVIEPGRLDAIITDIQFDLLADREYDGDGSTSRARITILHNQNPIALADCFANDGNGGYYFSALSLDVHVPDAVGVTTEVISA